MTIIDDHGRPEPQPAVNETETLLEFLDYQRATFAWKCSGLDADGLSVTIAASTMTLGGMMKHLALVEDYWFSQWLRGRDSGSAWSGANWDADPEWDWHSAAENTPEQLLTLWRASVEHSRVMVTEALAEGDLGQFAKRAWPDGRSPSMRWILVHMIEEYARHNGHADLIRESIDGVTGE
ncbi:MAG: DinB family protein [Acidimicrobiales bacterium]